MNVLYLINFAGQGGTERYVLSLAQGLQGQKNIKAYLAYNEDGLLRERMEEMGAPVFRVGMPGRFSLKSAKSIARLCCEHRIDVIHTQFLRENYLALMSKFFYKKPRVVYTNHIIQANDPLTRHTNRILSRNQHAVIAVCTPGREQLIRNGIPSGKIWLIHNGVDPADWQRLPGSTVRQEAGVPDGVPVILFAARFTEEKGHSALLDALSGLGDTPYHVLLAGDGELRGDTEKRAAESGLAERLTFLGFRNDMRAVMSATDICVNASSTEACSFSILESLAMGIPQAVADAGGNSDLIDGQNGILFSRNDPDALTNALRLLLTDADLRKKLSVNAAESAAERFTLEGMLNATYTIYQGGN